MKARLSRARAIAAAIGMLAVVRGFGAAPGDAKVAASPQPPIEVHFAPGTSSAVVNGRVRPGHAVTYSLYAVAGQTMSIKMDDELVCCLAPLEVHVPGGTLTDDTKNMEQTWTGTIRTTGPFDIVLRSGNPTYEGGYSMSISIFDRSAPAGIERFDFENGTVVADKETIRLKNGGLVRSPSIDRSFHAGLGRLPVFGFVDGYPDELALVWVNYDGGGTGAWADLNLFAMHRDKRVLVTDLQSGDRAEGGFRSARFDDGRLVVEVYAPQTPTGPMCCPAFVDTVRYRFAGGKLVRDGIATRRKAPADNDPVS